MKYTINYTCGHHGEVELFGANKERERKIAWHEGNVCPDCYKAQMEKAADKANNGLAALTGSEKQIKWATDIRAAYASNENYSVIANETNASWWINNRMDINAILRKRAQAAKVAAYAEMSKAQIFAMAHKATRTLKAKHGNINYSAQFGLVLKEIYANIKKCNVTMAA